HLQLHPFPTRRSSDLTTFLPQQAGGTKNLDGRTGGDGTVQFNLRGLLSKETLVLVDGKRVALGSLNAVGFSGGVDINLIPFPMIDRKSTRLNSSHGSI